MVNNELTVCLLTVGDPAFPHCKQALLNQDFDLFKLEIIENISPMSAAFQEMINRSETEYFIQVDEDMILDPNAIEKMYNTMKASPNNVGMICFHLWDEDREIKIQGIKIYRTQIMKKIIWRDIKASEIEILAQLERMGIKWILHPDIVGRHGVIYTPETIYLRYKTMYEKDILTWNVVTNDIKKKVEKFRETGDILELFALLGAAHGIINVPYCEDKEKDYHKYNLESLNIFKKIFLTNNISSLEYVEGKLVKENVSPNPISFKDIQWRFPIETDDFIKAIKILENRPIFIWGAGSGGKKTLELLQENEISVYGFIDNDERKIGTDINKVRVYGVGDLQNFMKQGVAPYVVIGSLYVKEISGTLRDLGMKDDIDFAANIYV